MKSTLIHNGRWSDVQPIAAIAFFLSFLFLLYGASVGIAQSAEPRRFPSARGGDCSICHDSDAKVPEGHEETKEMNFKDCLGCHAKGESLLADTLPLSHIHLLNSVSCTACHGTADPPTFVGTVQCLSCHIPDDLVAATKDVKEANPHNSHYGPQMDCDLCHHVHAASENFCNQCHDFKFVVPSKDNQTRKRIVKGSPIRIKVNKEYRPL